MHRLLSVTESSTLLDCSWRHALAYTGVLTDGDALEPRALPLGLSEGRAWGRAMAVYHGRWDRTDHLVLAQEAIRTSLDEDAEAQRAYGLLDTDELRATHQRLASALLHYHATTTPLPLYGAETNLRLPLNARQRHSNRYQLEVYLDGLHDDEHGTWVVEFKWRAGGRLRDMQLLVLDRQLRTYAWAWREHLGVEPVGLILDERVGEAPSPVRLNLDHSPSAVQSCTPEAYENACLIAMADPNPKTLERLRAKVWQARRRVTFRPGELDETADELRSLGRLVHLYDTQQLLPVRHPTPYNCGRCRFRDICPDPSDRELVDALYRRKAPKRLRPEEALTHAA